MSLRCPILMLYFLAIAVPLTVICWGGFWVIRQHWGAGAWTDRDRPMVRWLILSSAIILAELTVLVCVAADR